MRDIDRASDTMRAEASRDLAIKEIEEGARRRGEAFTVRGALTAAERDQAGIEEGRRRESFGLNENLFGARETERERQDQRRREGLDTAAELMEQSRGVRGETEARRQEALALASLLADLPANRLNLALATLAGQPTNAPGLFNQVLNLASVGQQGRALDQQRSANTFSGLGAIASLILQGGNLFGSGGGGGGNPFGFGQFSSPGTFTP